MTESQKLRLMQGWFVCLKNHGVPTHHTSGIDKPDVDEDDARYASNFQACRSKRPEAYTDRIARTDPSAFQDDLTKWIRCLKARGMPVAVNKDHTGVQFTDGRIAQTSEQMRNYYACEKQAFDE